MNNLGSVLSADTIKALDNVKKVRHARMAAYRLPVEPGRITFSALDPKGDGSRQPYKTSFVWGPSTNMKNITTLEDLSKCAEATTIKFVPFVITHDGKIQNGGLMPDPMVKTKCSNCNLEFTMTQTSFTTIKRRNVAYCQSCNTNGTPVNKCQLVFSGIVEDRVDNKILQAMSDCLGYESKTAVEEFTPNVYGVFAKGDAPGSSSGWEYSHVEEELVKRYDTLGMEIRPLKFLQDLYTKSSSNGRYFTWKKGVPKLTNLVVAANPINIGWFDNEELSKYPFSHEEGRANGFYCNFPRPSRRDSLV